MGDILVQRHQVVVANTGATKTITEVGSTDSAFIVCGNNRYQSGGWRTSAANMEIDDISGGVVLTDASTLTYYRESGGAAIDTTFDTEVWEYTGSAGGDNEFVVIGRYSHTFTAGQGNTGVTVTAPTDRDRCIPIITGLKSSDPSDGGARATAALLMTTNTNVQVYVGGTGGSVTVYFTLVEFTGSNWEVYHGGVVNSGDTGTIDLVEESGGTGTAATVTDWETAIIFTQARGDNLSDANQAIADNFPVYTSGSDTSSIDWTYNANHDGATNFHFVHVLRHPDMVVQRVTDTQNAAGTMNVTIPTTLSDITEASVIVSRVSSGTGTAYGRGWVNARISSTSNVELWAHRSGNTISTEIQVIDLSNIATAVLSTRRIFIV